MPTPAAPMTPSTLATIRYLSQRRQAQDIAATIGWEMERLCRVAKNHQIELLGGSPLLRHVTSSVLQPPAQPAAPSLAEIINDLPDRQRKILSVLKKEINGRFIPGAELRERIGSQRRDISVIVQDANANLRRQHAGVRVESRKGEYGGYRLVTAGNGA
jgi:biotin operon repressor